jgi:hypothetical protein
VEGGATVLLKLLARVCGPVPEELEQRVRRLPIERLEALGEARLDFRSVQEVQAWLDAKVSARTLPSARRRMPMVARFRQRQPTS